jgi:hypothetical protein
MTSEDVGSGQFECLDPTRTKVIIAPAAAIPKIQAVQSTQGGVFKTQPLGSSNKGHNGGSIIPTRI